MAVERWQLCRNYEINHRRCAETKTIPKPDAAHGRGGTYAGPDKSNGSVCVEFEPLGTTKIAHDWLTSWFSPKLGFPRDAMVLKVRGPRGRSGGLHTNCGRSPRKFRGATARWIAADSETNGRVTAGKFVAPGLERRAVNRPACPNRANNIRRHQTRGCSLPGQPDADRF